MAIYHFSSKVIGKSQGRTAVAAAAYRSATSLLSQSTGINFDYSKKKGVVFSEIMTPAYAPAWTQEREALWNAVEASEKRKDAQYCREIEVALPKELTLDQNKQLLQNFIDDNFVSRGMIADYAIHDIDTQNPHCHILLTTRIITENGFGQKERSWNDRELFTTWREEWASLTNKHLAINGHEITIDHRSHAERGIDLVPTLHEGIQRKDRFTQDRFQKQQDIKKINAERIIENPNIALELLSRHQAVFTHHDIAKLANIHSNTTEEFEAVRNAIQYHGNIVPLGIGADKKEYFTTQQTLENENEFLKTAENLSHGTHHFISSEKVAFVSHGKQLNDGQQKALKHILESNDLSIMVGFAGTGKSYLINVLREAYESQGYQIMGAALSGKVAESLQNDTRIRSHTIARYLIDWENGRQNLHDKSVFIVDEASMVGTRQFLALVKEAQRAKAKMIVIGDPEQLQPIESGNPFRTLTERYPKTTLSEIIRQKTDWQKEATIELSTHKTAKALNRYQEAGFIHECQDITEAKQALMAKWIKDREEYSQDGQLMLTYRNQDVLDLNHEARQYLKQAGTLSTAPEASLIISTDRFGKLEFSVNDRVMFLQNDNSLQVKNGALATVIEINKKRLGVKMDDGREIWFDPEQYSHLTHGYAATVHKSQGTTIDRSYVLATRRFDRFLANVSMDRHRYEVNLFYAKSEFPSYQALSDTLSKGQDKIMAIEFAQARGMEYPFNQDAKTQQQVNLNSLEKQTSEAQSLEAQGLSQTTIALIREYYQQQAVFAEAMVKKMDYLGEDREKTRYYADLALDANKTSDKLSLEIANQADIKMLYQQLTTEQLVSMPKLGQKELEELRQQLNAGNVNQQSLFSIAKHFQGKANAVRHAQQLSQSQEEGWSY